MAQITISQSEPLPDRPEPSESWKTPAGRLALRLDEVAASLGLSRRTVERERSAGRFPQPDIKVGKAPLWSPETIRAWIEGGGHR